MNSAAKLLTVALLIAGFSYDSSGQVTKYTQTVNAAGGSKNIGTNNYEWSVGEMTLVNTATASNIIVTQGVLQPAQGTGYIQDNDLLRFVSVFPVPAKDIVYLEYQFRTAGKLEYYLQDITGKTILSTATDVTAEKAQKTISLQALANATYMLYINFTSADGNRSSSSYKLEKIN